MFQEKSDFDLPKSLGYLQIAFGKSADAEKCLKIVAELSSKASVDPLKLYGLSCTVLDFGNLTLMVQTLKNNYKKVK